MLERAKQAGVEYIIVPGIEAKDFDRLIKLTDNNDFVYCGIGVHPQHAHEIKSNDLDRIEGLASNAKVIAIGEIGLDYYYEYCPPEQQRIVFRKQLEIAIRTKLPVIIHNRDSDADLMKILTEEQDGSLGGVLHCFSGDIAMLKDALELGFHISFTGNITYKKSLITEIVEQVPMERLLLETDSPYMTPSPYRGKRNEPANVRYVAEKISEIKSINFDEVIKMTTNNAKNLFRLNAMVLIFILMLGLAFTTPLFSQNEEEQEPETEQVKTPNPYDKGLGFGIDIGTNTIVETQYYMDLKKSVSYEGIFFWGLKVNYAMLDYLYLEATYTYSKNTKITDKNPELGPNIHKVLELTSQWIANPRSKISFFGMGGLTFFQNTLNEGRAFIESSDSPIGFNFGIGVRFQIPVKTVGIFDIVGEWRLNWAPGRVDSKTFWDRGGQPVDIENTKFFSMPRASLVFYPEFLRFLTLD
jgi:TatD DNase family protein